MNYEIIATGSDGNCVIINDCVAIDMGVPFKALKEQYKRLKLVLFTHVHTDHLRKSTVKRMAAERPSLRFACCEWLFNTLLDCGVDPGNIDVLEVGKKYDYKVFQVSPVLLYHDVPNCGYRLYFGGEKLFYATDTAHLEGITANGYDLYMLESNYTEAEIKSRIESKIKNGLYSYELTVPDRHLSFEQANDFLVENMGKQSAFVYLHQHKGVGSDGL